MEWLDWSEEGRTYQVPCTSCPKRKANSGLVGVGVTRCCLDTGCGWFFSNEETTVGSVDKLFIERRASEGDSWLNDAAIDSWGSSCDGD